MQATGDKPNLKRDKNHPPSQQFFTCMRMRLWRSPKEAFSFICPSSGVNGNALAIQQTSRCGFFHMLFCYFQRTNIRSQRQEWNSRHGYRGRDTRRVRRRYKRRVFWLRSISPKRFSGLQLVVNLIFHSRICEAFLHPYSGRFRQDTFGGRSVRLAGLCGCMLLRLIVLSEV